MKNNYSYKVCYREHNNYFTITSNDKNLDVVVKDDNNHLTVSLLPKIEMELVSFKITKHYDFNTESVVYLNGYQSWTDSKELDITDKQKSLDKVPKFVMNRYHFDRYGDYDFIDYSNKEGIFHGFTYGYIKLENSKIILHGSLNDKNAYGIIKYDLINKEITFSSDIEGKTIASEYVILDIVEICDEYESAFDTYFELLKIKKPTGKKMIGYDSWYNHYQNITEEILLDNIASLSGRNLDIFEIDDGYQSNIGDWLIINKEKLPNGLLPISKAINEQKMIPAIWLAPFACTKDSNVYKDHLDWVVKDNNNVPICCGSNWGGFYALDILNIEVQEYLKNVFNEMINTFGFKAFKLDFLYACSVVPRNNFTRSELMFKGIDLIVECLQGSIFHACGTPLSPCFGKVDYMRIGCDVSLKYDDSWIMRRFHRERVSTKNCLLNTVYRRSLDGRAFLNDPDVFLLRDDNISLTKEQKETLGLINSLFGSLLLTSDNYSTYDNEKIALYNEIIANTKVKILKIETNKNKLVVETEKKTYNFTI